MKVKKLAKILPKIVSGLGDDDLTISLARSNKKYYISISTHTSNQFQFDHGGYQRTCELRDEDLEKDSHLLVRDLVNTYNKLLKPKEEESDVIERD